MSSTAMPTVVPAQLSFLAIYNPSLGRSDETFHRQLVFYYSTAAKSRSKPAHGDAQKEHELREQANEKLRQVGLAQGMVGFARTFSNGAPVDSVETQKSRIVLHELEDGWWILASADLTQLPAAHSASRAAGVASSEPAVEYSSREVSPPALLIRQLVRAQAGFLLHHGTTLETMFHKHGRPKFCSILDKYWTRFATTWDVLLHGSPAVDIYGGMKLAAGGELGMGVGEEEWGSSERDVLEDFARRTEDLVDVVVSRFGEASPLQLAKSSADPELLHVAGMDPWVGCGKNVDAADGVVFSGLGAVSRKSLRDISHWVESMYAHGEYAYGVRDNPSADRRKRQRRSLTPEKETSPESVPLSTRNDRKPPVTTDSSSTLPPGVPPPIVKAAESSLDNASAAVAKSTSGGASHPDAEAKPMLASLGDTETWMQYMTLGYGSAWGGSKKTPHQPQPKHVERARTPSPAAMRYIEPEPDIDMAEEKIRLQIQLENDGYFLVGLKGDMRDLDFDDDNDHGNWNNRIPLRTIHVEVDRNANSLLSWGVDSDDQPQYEKDMAFTCTPANNLTRLRPVVYVHRPFIYTFLFTQRAPALSLSSFYRNLHTFFSPLHRLLDSSTSPSRVAARLSAAANPHTTSSQHGGAANTSPIYDLVFDPRTFTTHSSVPNIPDLSPRAPGAWSRPDALNVHAQILATVASTRTHRLEIERTAKTARAWWVVWMRLPPSSYSPPPLPTPSASAADTHTPSDPATEAYTTDDLREAFLVRRALDAPLASSSAAAGGSGAAGRFASGMWSGLTLGMGGRGGGRGATTRQSEQIGGATAGRGPNCLAEGIGIDARRYVEELLSLNR